MEAAVRLRVRPDDPAYRRQAEAEAEFWSTPHPLGLEGREEAREPLTPGDFHENERFTGDPKVAWYETLGRYGTFRRGLVLGTSALRAERRILETNPGLHLTFLDLSAAALARREAVLGARFPGRVSQRVADLNFVELEPGYDLIVSSSSLHHVTNLEHLAEQINRGLTSNGFFFLNDYVGETRFRFFPEKKRVFEVLHDRHVQPELGRPRGVTWRDGSDLSPFCGVRSAEILAVLRTYLREVQVRTASTLLVPLMRSNPLDAGTLPGLTGRQLVWGLLRGAWRRLRGLPPPKLHVSPELMRDLVLVGDALSDAGILLPCNAFAVYRKLDDA